MKAGQQYKKVESNTRSSKGDLILSECTYWCTNTGRLKKLIA